VAVLTYSEIQNLALDRAQANVTTDAPFSSAEIARFINDAYADVWEIAGGSVKLADSATAWASTATAVGTIQGALSDINEVLHIYAVSSAALQSIACTTNSTTTVTSSALFGSVTIGMLVSGSGIPAGAVVTAVASTSSLTISKAATSGTTPTLVFTKIVDAAELDRVEYAQLLHYRGVQGYGTYANPKICSVERASTETATGVNLFRLDYWPGVTGFYFPISYIPQFTPIDSATITTPDVNDLESRDISLLTAARMCPLIGRAEFVPSILADVSSRTAATLERKMQALMSGDQDK